MEVIWRIKVKMLTFVTNMERDKTLIMDAVVLVRYLILKLDSNSSQGSLLAFFVMKFRMYVNLFFLYRAFIFIWI